MINLKNTNIILTGATGGIGNCILEKLVKVEANILATGTNEEKLNPSIIDGSRKKRIAKGCGRPVQEVNTLLKQYNQMKVMMKKINKGKMNFPFIK